MRKTNNVIVRDDNKIEFHQSNFQILIKYNFFYSLPIATGAIYVKKYFHAESKESITHLVNTVHKELLTALNTASWMDEKTKVAAIAKANSMHFHIAHPNELVDNNKMNEYYNDLELQSNSLLDNLLRIRTFNNKNLIKQLRKPINKTDWETHSMILSVNAYYSHTENSIRTY